MESAQSTSFEGISSEAIPMDVQESRSAIAATGGARPKVRSVAEGSTPAKDAEIITLISNDGESFLISRAAANGSSKIQELLKETGTTLELDFKKNILKKVVEYLNLKDDHEQKRSVSTEFEMDEEMALEMLAAACFLDC